MWTVRFFVKKLRRFLCCFRSPQCTCFSLRSFLLLTWTIPAQGARGQNLLFHPSDWAEGKTSGSFLVSL